MKTHRATPVGAVAVLALAGVLTAAEAPGKRDGGPICISGVYPHLTAFNGEADPKRPQWRGGGGECGIGAVVPWAGKLWMLTYSPHCPRGSADKLYAVGEDLSLEVRPESVGGTPAGRMVHRESKQLFIGPYVVDAKGNVRVISPKVMPGRLTAVSRHLTDPANRVYYFDMEGAIYEVHVRTLAVTKLFGVDDRVPGCHGKGAYTGQGRYIIANNGERGGPRNSEEMGALAEWDGKEWRVVERKQFCDVTGPGGIHGSPDDTSPVWAIGWDRRSVILKLLDGGTWYTFRLPKGTHTYDHRGGWYTEWPRIREIAPGKLMMDMHGMFWDFPKGFSAKATGGLRPIATHHRYIPDFCHWNGRVVLATDETAVVGGNKLAGRSQSNLWFGKVEDLSTWGPRAGWGGPWVSDAVKANEPSVPFAIGGFPRRCLHLSTGRGKGGAGGATGIYRCTGRFEITELPAELAGLVRVTIDRGDYHEPAGGYSFTVNQDAVVYLLVDRRGNPDPGEGWKRTAMTAAWGTYTDAVYVRTFPKGRVQVPPNRVAHKPDAYGLPHTCFVKPAKADAPELKITGLSKDVPGAQVVYAAKRKPPAPPPAAKTDVTFTLEIDARGDGKWKEYTKLTLPPDGYRFHIFPADFQADWIRITADTDCVATAYFHYSEAKHDPLPVKKPGEKLFASLASVGDPNAMAGLIRPGKNRNLQYLARVAVRQAHRPERSRRADAEGKVHEAYWEVDQTLAFSRPAQDRADEVRKIAVVTKDFETDDASVIMTHRGRRFRLPKGDARYDKPFAAGWPRGTRECESERYLMSIHGTFYEKPREAGLPGIKPVATHNRQIMDFCTWRGLLVISGTGKSARPDGHYFRAEDGRAGLWFGAIDDVWKLGKPVGRGGPWRKTAVKAGAPSDPYLMTGFDRKSVELSHDAPGEAAFTLEVDFAHSGWRTYRVVEVPAGKAVTHRFPEGFSAHWVRLTADKDCTATAWFVYE